MLTRTQNVNDLMGQQSEKEFFDTLPVKLTAQQRQAVVATKGSTLLLAVPGSGKTTTLVIRLGYMIFVEGIAPENILVVTYTVSATKDMRERFAGIFGRELSKRIEFRTINGICSIIIRNYEQMIGKKAFSLLQDEKQLKTIVGRLYREITDEYGTVNEIDGARTLITYIKNMMLSDDEIDQLSRDAGYDAGSIYRAYKKELRDHRLMDYDDQMIYALNMLRQSPELLAGFRDRFRYICMDESQDTSKIQHEIIRFLAARDRNIFMVGDEDQSIYGFRAAYPEALLSFEETYPGGQVLLMEDNFRSDENIVQLADSFIQKNMLRHKKSMRATRPAKNRPYYVHLRYREDQYDFLTRIASECTRETAVLYRENDSAVPLIDLLERNGIPYRLKRTDTSFFTNRVVMDVMNILRFALNPTDEELFMQIYYKINSYISKGEALDIVSKSRRNGESILDIAIHYCDKKKQQNLEEISDSMRNITQAKSAFSALSTVLYQLGFMDYLRRSQIGDGKIPLLRAIAKREKSAESFLDRLSDLQEIITEKEPDDDCPFILSTIHSSKGLEYDTVYLMDIIDGVFPGEIPGAGAEKEEFELYEEERRIFYVGMTRAKNELVFLRAGESTFMEELFPRKHKTAAKKAAGRKTEDNKDLHLKGAHNGVASKDIKVDEKTLALFVAGFMPGCEVVHKKYGQGRVIVANIRFINVRFDLAGEKSFSTKHVYIAGLIEVAR